MPFWCHYITLVKDDEVEGKRVREEIVRARDAMTIDVYVARPKFGTSCEAAAAQVYQGDHESWKTNVILCVHCILCFLHAGA